MKAIKLSAMLLSLLAMVVGARAEIVVGVTVSTSGPAAYSGMQHANVVKLFPTTIGGEKVRYVVLNDESDPTLATKNARKFITEEKADVIIGGTVTPLAIAVSVVAAESKVPLIAPSPFDVPSDRLPWVFMTAQETTSMAKPLFEHMKKRNIKTIAFIGVNDAFGESWLKATEADAMSAGIKVVAVERFARTDTSVAGQALKIVAAQPDAVLVGSAGPASAMAQSAIVERGYKGFFYHTHGAATQAFLKAGGPSVNGAVFTAGPMFVVDQLPPQHPSKKVSQQFVDAYKNVYGEAPSNFAGYMYDAGLLLQRAVPIALKKAKPGTTEFRAALRDALEGVNSMPGVHGVYTMSAVDHFGHDKATLVLVTVEDGRFKYMY